MRVLKIIGSAVALAGCLAISARAQDTAEVKRLTILTFSNAVQVPGMTLPAGKYRFEIADSNGAAHVVRVLNEDGQKLITSFMTVPRTIATRDLTDDNTLIMFAERPAGQPQAAKEWFYPGRSMGEEFIYPKSVAIEIAKANHTTVAAVDEGSGGKVGRVNENGELTNEPAPASTEASAAPASSSTSTSAPRNQVAEAQPPATTAPATSSAPASTNTVGTSGQAPTPAATAPNSLPRTASPLGLFALLGGLSLAAAFGVSQVHRRFAVNG